MQRMMNVFLYTVRLFYDVLNISYVLRIFRRTWNALHRRRCWYDYARETSSWQAVTLKYYA